MSPPIQQNIKILRHSEAVHRARHAREGYLLRGARNPHGVAGGADNGSSPRLLAHKRPTSSSLSTWERVCGGAGVLQAREAASRPHALFSSFFSLPGGYFFVTFCAYYLEACNFLLIQYINHVGLLFLCVFLCWPIAAAAAAAIQEVLPREAGLLL